MTKFYKTDTQETLTFEQAKTFFPRTGIPNNPSLESVIKLFATENVIPILTFHPKPEDSLGITWEEGVSYNEETNIASQVWNERAMTTEEAETYLSTVKLRYETAVQSHLDNQAQLLRFDNIMTAVSYADEPSVPSFQQEGLALRAWRSLVWAYVYQALDDVLTGERAQPSIEQLISELPTFVNP